MYTITFSRIYGNTVRHGYELMFENITDAQEALSTLTSNTVNVCFFHHDAKWDFVETLAV